MPMFEDKKITLNRKFAKTEGWNSIDFGASDFNNELITKIKQFQQQYGLEPDGIVGPATYRRLMTEKEAKTIASQKYIICSGKEVPIEWNKVITFRDKNGFVAPEGTYKKANRTNINMLVVHFDVCLSSKSCFDVLKQRKISVPFLIDNDGSIYQTLDTQHIAWHAAGVNTNSVGVEISNAFYTKFQNSYEKMGLIPRPVISDSIVHGQKLDPHLGFYDIQIQALKALCKALNRGLGVKLQSPESTTVVAEVVDGSYQGIIHHYQVTKNKIDSTGLDLTKLMEEIKNG